MTIIQRHSYSECQCCHVTLGQESKVMDTVNQAGQRVVDRTLGIQPTIRVRPGWSVNVLVTRDLILRPYPLGGTP